MRSFEEMQIAHDAFWFTIENNDDDVRRVFDNDYHLSLSRLNANTLCWCIGCKNPRHAEMLLELDACIKETVSNAAIIALRRLRPQ